MPFHTPHKYNTNFQKDPAIERWVYQRYFGQFGNFRVNAYALKWLVGLYVIVPVGLFYWNESYTRWIDDFKEEDVNSLRFGRVDPSRAKVELYDVEWLCVAYSACWPTFGAKY
ncbi:hypothetical protein MP638_003503 [Amoeboaphelidium occidentale]|nr:hypothetical protein MP638_003503 [Amoeboaphelidium occidentale]